MPSAHTYEGLCTTLSNHMWQQHKCECYFRNLWPEHFVCYAWCNNLPLRQTDRSLTSLGNPSNFLNDFAEGRVMCPVSCVEGSLITKSEPSTNCWFSSWVLKFFSINYVSPKWDTEAATHQAVWRSTDCVGFCSQQSLNQWRARRHNSHWRHKTKRSNNMKHN